jgi:predicted regulator of Ras-like GTPase activity (Roadblock/LC7/MglB family)
MSVTASTPIDLSSVVEFQEPLEAVLLITRTGAQLGAWTRNSVPVDVLSVMAATLVGSIETLMTALGASSPREVSLMIDGRRVFVSKVNAQVVVVVVAAASMTEVALRATMRHIVKSLPPFPSDSDRSARDARDRRRS